MSDGCIERDRLARVRIYQLDSCDRILITGSTVLDYSDWESIAFADQIQAGTRETITGVTGATLRDKLACPTDRGQQLTFTEFVENWAMLALTGFGSIVLTSTTPTGFDREEVDCTAAVAVEIIFATPISCTGGTTQVLSRLYPKVDTFTVGGNKVVNGQNVLRGNYVGNTQLNPNIFGNFSTSTPTGELLHWATYKTDVNAGNAFYYDRVMDSPVNLVSIAESCDLRALVTSGS